MKKRKYSTYSSEQLSYTEDIVKEIIRLNKWKFGYKKSVEVMEILFDYMAYQSKQDNVFSFNIPYLGYMYKPEKFLQNEKVKKPTDSPERKQKEDEILQIHRFSDENNSRNPHKLSPLTLQYLKPLLKEYDIEDNQVKSDRPSIQILSAIEDKQNRDLKIKR